MTTRLIMPGAGALLFVALAAFASVRGAPAGSPAPPDAGRAAFLKAYEVFMHPRCMNCHPAGNVPLQGDDSRPHAQGVKRGPDGNGLYAMKCSNCHQPANVSAENHPPGTPSWHLPHPGMPLVFQGRTPAQLAAQLKDPKLNGGKSLEQLLHHLEHDPLVLWGWDPGPGRSKPPLSHAEFVRQVKLWIDAGAPVPATAPAAPG